MHTKSLSNRKQGQALVEFALILPVVLFLIFGILDFGRLLIAYTSASGNLRAAARYATVVGLVGTRRYLDCAGMEATARNVFFVNSQTVTINYIKANTGTTIPCASISDAMLENGDILQINSTNTVNLITPFLNNIWPNITLNFTARRTIVKDITLLATISDTEPDGLEDAWEMLWFGTLNYSSTDDPDGDGLNNGLEEILGTNPTNPDTDGDSANSCGRRLWDGEEVFVYGTNPTNPDTDGDGISDGEELCNGTDPLSWQPIAVDDIDIVSNAGWTRIVDVLANDRAQQPENLYIVRFDAVTTQGGRVRLITNGSTGVGAGRDDYFEYQAPLFFVGTDTFTYTITDASGVQSTATVTLNVNAGSATPVPTAVPADFAFEAPFWDPVLEANRDWWRLNNGAVFMGYEDWQVEWWAWSGATIDNVNAEMSTPPDCTVTQGYNAPLAFNWGTGGPAPGGDCGTANPWRTDNFIARWTRSFGVANDFTATFKIMADDAIRIFIDGSPVVNQWVLGAGRYETSINYTFSGGVEHTIVVEYAEYTGNALVIFAPHDGTNEDRGLCGWAMTNDSAYQDSIPSWTDFPNINYYPDTRCHLELRGTVNLATLTTPPQMSFWNRWVLADASDVAWLQFREAGTNTWYGQRLHQGPETQLDWTREVIDLSAFSGESMTNGTPATLDFTGKTIEFRFMLQGGDDPGTEQGWWIDEILIDQSVPEVYTIGFFDDMESGNRYWLPGSQWAITTERAYSGISAWSDSPYSNYSGNASYLLQLNGVVDITDTTVATSPELVFYHAWRLGVGDSIFVDISYDEITWTPLTGGPLATGDTNTAFTRQEIPLSGYQTQPFYLRFRLTSDAVNESSGWWIDDVAIQNHDNSFFTYPFFDDMELGGDNWLPGGRWTISPESAYSGFSAWSDSPGGTYVHGSNSSLQTAKRFNLAAGGATQPELSFWYRRDIAATDAFYVEISTDMGATWQTIWSYQYRSNDGSTNPEAPDSTGTSGVPWVEFNRQLAWERVSVDMTPYISTPFYLRFRMDARADTAVGDGVWLDDIRLAEYTGLTSPHTLPFSDDMEGTTNWRLGGSWNLSNESRHGGTYALTDSPNISYTTDTWSVLELIKPIDLRGLGANDFPILYWWDRFALSQYDYARVQVSVWNGPGWSNWSAWTEISQHYYNTVLSWDRRQADLRPFKGKLVRIRFVLDALQQDSVADGWWIDDVSVQLYNPTITPYTSFYEDADSLAGWVPDGTWGISGITRSAGSGSGAFGPGSWSAYFYDLEQYGTCGGATDAQRAEKAMLGQTFPTGTGCSQNLGATYTPYGGGPVPLSAVNFNCSAGAIPHPDGTCSTTSWKTGYDHFAIKFVRAFTVPATRQYDFSVTHNDGARLYIYPAGPYTNPVINRWMDTEPLTPTDAVSVTLGPGAYTIELWYYDNTGPAAIQLNTAVPSFSFHDSPLGSYAYRDDMSLTLDGLIDLTGATQPVLSWYESYDLADETTCVVPEISLPYVSFNRWVAVATEVCGPATSTTWQLREAPLRALIQSRFGLTPPYTGNNALLALRFRLSALGTATADGWWVDDISMRTNSAPIAVNDTYTTAEDTPLIRMVPGVLGNDSDPDGDTLTATVASNPSRGALTLSANGAFTYTPLLNYNGSDSFTYTVSDGKGGTATATVSITITPVNDPPVANNDSYSVKKNSTLNVAAPGVLSNDTDVEGSPLTAILVAGPANGTLTLNANGSFTYSPKPGYTGTDSFTYRASDGSATSNVATVTIRVN
ncbi:MAG: tandem-95 repeat protein [Anaerolineae bacterium]|nr:tandem-95 repeat protein [Anaerolineae bacterium]